MRIFDAGTFTHHGGRIAAARAAFPHAPEPWIDLSTGVNPMPYRAVRAAAVWDRLPDPNATARLEAIAAEAFGARPDQVVAIPGADIALRLLPYVTQAKSVAIVEPTYGGHREAWTAAGADIQGIAREDCYACTAEALVVVNPNNPDGAKLDTRALQRPDRWLIVDESFADVQPDLSIADAVAARTIVLRSFGKFYGLPGLRLGFVIAARDTVARMRRMLGDWPVNAAAIAMGSVAYADHTWAVKTRAKLTRTARRLDRTLISAGFEILGGTALFRLVRANEAQARFQRLAEAGVLVRPFADQPTWLRIGLPRAGEWPRLLAALQDMS